MSQVTKRKGGVGEEAKRTTNSPTKDLKKKMTAASERESTSVEKNTEKPTEKKSEKKPEQNGKDAKPAEKVQEAKSSKSTEKNKDAEKNGQKEVEKNGTKEPEKNGLEKAKEDSKAEKSTKSEPAKPTLNGASNGTVSEDTEMRLDSPFDEGDEMFPELTYDDGSDTDFEVPTPEGRSFTRRSQDKTTPTPKTAAADEQKYMDTVGDNASKESKLLKLKDDVPSRNLRSADSPKPHEKETREKSQEKKEKAQEAKEKSQEKQKPLDGKRSSEKVSESPKKMKQSVKENKEAEDTKRNLEKAMESPKKSKLAVKENGDAEKSVIELDSEPEISTDECRKTDTNYSKSRVKVSPYRRSMRLADNTATSILANYTGNNTTMEMDITETSVVSEEPSLNESSYLAGVRSIRGRRSYKLMKDVKLTHLNKPRLNTPTLNATVTSQESSSRPTGTVVGRKRKPESEIELASEAEMDADLTFGKRMRLLDRIAMPFRRTLPIRRVPELQIVGINTDIPLSSPVTPSTFDPESLKHNPSPHPGDVPPPARDNKRCVVM